MKKNKIVISIFVAVCIIGTIVGYSLIKQKDSNKYNQLAVMTLQDDGTYITSNMSAFGNDDYEFDHAVCNNGTTVTANSNGGVNLKLLGTDKCTIYLKKSESIVVDNIKSSVKTIKPDFTQVAPNYKVSEDITINYIYEDYDIEGPYYYNEGFTYNEQSLTWYADGGYATLSLDWFHYGEPMAMCYETAYSSTGSTNFYIKNSTTGREDLYEIDSDSSCIILTPSEKGEDYLEIIVSSPEDEGVSEVFNFYLVADYILNDSKSGVYTMEDDYGTSYYFRGDVKNNYVKFGDYYWRIVRLNGDGSLRIIYDGTTPHANGEPSTDRALGKSEFNDDKSHIHSNAYIGYMYGDINGTTYDAVHANTYDSTIKTFLDSWYETNIRDKGLAGYVSDTLFCNDRSVTSGTGIGTTPTDYESYTRATTDANPILTCPQKNDAFTVNDTVKGNGALTYSIGLLTADEFRLAGGKYETMSQNNYLDKGREQIWWLGSPYKNQLILGNSELGVHSKGLTKVYVNDPSNDNRPSELGGEAAYNSASVVPVINLTAEYVSKLKGSGTMEDPYTA